MLIYYDVKRVFRPWYDFFVSVSDFSACSLYIRISVMLRSASLAAATDFSCSWKRRFLSSSVSADLLCLSSYRRSSTCFCCASLLTICDLYLWISSLSASLSLRSSLSASWALSRAINASCFSLWRLSFSLLNLFSALSWLNLAFSACLLYSSLRFCSLSS